MMPTLHGIFQCMGTGLLRGDTVWTKKNTKTVTQGSRQQQEAMVRNRNRNLGLKKKQENQALIDPGRVHEELSWGGSMRESN